MTMAKSFSNFSNSDYRLRYKENDLLIIQNPTGSSVLAFARQSVLWQRLEINGWSEEWSCLIRFVIQIYI